MKTPEPQRGNERQGLLFASVRSLGTAAPLGLVLLLSLIAAGAAAAQPPPRPWASRLDPYIPLLKQIGFTPELLAVLQSVHIQGLEGEDTLPKPVSAARATAAATVGPVRVTGVPSAPGSSNQQAAVNDQAVPAVADQRQSLYLERLKQGDRSPELLAYLRSLSKDELVRLMEATPRWSREDQRLSHHLVSAVMDAHGVSADNIGGLSDSAVLALADYYREQCDERCVKLYEGLLGKRKGKSDAFVPELQGLAEYYRKVGESARAAETFLRAEAYTTDKPTLANSTVEGAREYVRAGDPKRAQEAYDRVAAYGYGWATGMALFDRGRELIERGRHGEARKLLSTTVSGTYADQIMVGLLAQLGRSCYLTGELEQAEQYLRAAIQQYQSLKNPLAGEGLEAMANGATGLLHWVSLWKRRPIFSAVDRINLISKPGHSRAKFTLTLCTAQNADLLLTAQPDFVKARIVGSRRNEYCVEHQVLVEAESPPSSTDMLGKLTVARAENSTPFLEIPVYIGRAPRLRWSCATAFFGFVDPGKTSATTLSVSSDEPFNILKVSCGNQLFRCYASHAAHDSRHWEVLVVARADNKDAGKAVRGQLRVETDVKGQEVIEIPCYVHVSGKNDG